MTHKPSTRLKLLLTLLLLAAPAYAAAQQPPPPRPEPSDADGFFVRAVERHRAGQLGEAVEDYQNVLRLKPDFVGAHLNLGLAYAQLDRLDDALASLKRALGLA